MKASIGRVCIVKGGVAMSNGSDRAPAIINRVWNEGCDTRNAPVLINTTLFPDCAPPTYATSINLYDTEADGDRSCDPVFAFWPTRE